MTNLKRLKKIRKYGGPERLKREMSRYLTHQDTVMQIRKRSQG